ncbi:MAG: hypothetical protein AAGA50_21900 [Pseudomonadota bacterium]
MYFIRDTRTGLHFAVSLEPAQLEEFQSLVQSLGLGQDHSLDADELLKRQSQFREQLVEERRSSAIETVLDLCSRSIPYYKSITPEPNGDVSLASYPIMDKAALKKNYRDLINPDLDVSQHIKAGNFAVVRNSGTTDERIQVISDMNLDRVPPDYQDVWQVNFDSDTPQTAILTTPLCSPNACTLQQDSLESRIQFNTTLFLPSSTNILKATDAYFQSVCDEIEAFSPEILLGSPVYIQMLGKWAQENTCDLSSIKVILVSYQFCSGIQRRYIERFFGVPVFDLYTATELGGCGLGVQCCNGNWHVREDHCFLETIPFGTAPSGAEVGSLIVTTHANQVAPLVRYDVGDLGILRQNVCNCSVSDWQCFELHGRKSDAMMFGETCITTRIFDDIISGVEGIFLYQCQQTADGVSVSVVHDPEFDFSETATAQLLKDRLKLSAVDVNCTDNLIFERSFKLRYTRPL